MSDVTLTPPSGVLTLTGGDPIISGASTVVVPGAAVVVVSASEPIITGAMTVITPAAALLTVTGSAPIITGVVKTVSPAKASLTLTGGAPNVTISRVTCDVIVAAVEKQKLVEERIRREQPVGRIWDAEWNCQHVMGSEYSAKFSWISNDTGPGQTEFPFESPIAQWIYDYQGRIDRGEGRTVGITIDYGARWSGILDKFSVEQREDGDRVLVVDWVHDYEQLKWYYCVPNPFLPDAFQAPRAWIAAGPCTWVLRLTLFLAIWREHNPFLTWPDDPLDFRNWATMGLDISNWHTVVKPESFFDAMASGVVWSVVSSRWESFHDMAHYMLEDSELSVVCRRYLPGDPDPWPGANLRYGTLVIDFVDKSGIQIGTSNGGNVFDGLVRTVNEFADDFLDSTSELISDAVTPTEYFSVNKRYTDRVKPYVIFYEGDTSAVQTSSWIYSPTKGVQISVGGHSAPGTNEVISASIQALGDVLGNLVQIGSLGGTIDTLLAPLYEDTILAWQSYKSNERANNTGWDRLFSYFQQGAGKAYTISALLVLRAGLWATKTVVSWKVSVADGRPYLVGDQGQGHFFLDDRVGLVLSADNKIHMDRCRRLDLGWGPDSPPEWTINIGDERIWQDPAQRALGRIERLIAGLHNLGVW